jgi:hypothetical protein
MRNGNIALGLGVLVVALLAATGKLQALWTAVMKAEQTVGSSGTAAVNPQALLPDQGVSSSGSVGSFGPGTGAVPGSKADIGISIAPYLRGAQNTTIYAGQDPALDTVFAQWPAGRQTEWNAFLDCFFSTGSVDVCARRGLVLSTEGKG